jgi:hypothetical protein
MFARKLLAALFSITSAFGCLGVASGQQGTLIGLFERGRQAFAAQDFQEALAAFSELEREFAAEPEYAEPSFQRAMLPLYGMSALLAGDTPVASRVLDLHLDRFFERNPQGATLLLGMIQALRQSGELQGVDRYYERF